MKQNTFDLPLLDIPASGLSETFTEEALWQRGIREFSLQCTLQHPITVTVNIQRFQEGCRILGSLTGDILLPCSRCAEESVAHIDWHFEDFEPMPSDAETADLNEESRITNVDGVYVLDLAALLWEEFLLALPQTHLCSEQCKGLCPTCGKNLNEGQCSCTKNDGDPRMAIFRHLRLDKKSAANTKATFDKRS